MRDKELINLGKVAHQLAKAGRSEEAEEKYRIILEKDPKDVYALVGLPRKAIITSEEVRESLEGPVKAITSAIKTTLEKTSPELSSDLVDRGVVLAGGGVLLRGLDRVIEEDVQLPVTIADDPLTVVARGTGVVLQQLGLLKRILDSAED